MSFAQADTLHGRVSAIVRIVAKYHRVKEEDIMGKSKMAKVVAARHEVWHRMNVQMGFSYSRIAQHCNVDRASVQKACENVERR